MPPKISIIIPVYNSEKYLERCVASILQQTFSDFEILLIDDGSAAPCATLCDQLASHDSRIKVFHKPNGGTSSARNYGLAHANGDYITFSDNDDYVLPNWLSSMYEAALSANADVVRCGFHLVRDTDLDNRHLGEIKPPPAPLFTYSYTAEQLSGLDYLLRMVQADGYVQIWNMLVKSEIIRQCSFWEGHLCEDVKIVSDIMQRSSHVLLIESIGYCFVQHPRSQSHVFDHNFVSDSIAVWTEIADILEKKYQCSEGSRRALAIPVRRFFFTPASIARIQDSMRDPAFLNNWNQIRVNIRLRDIAPYLSPILIAQYILFSISPALYAWIASLYGKYTNRTACSSGKKVLK